MLSLRVGLGYDIHRLVPGRKLILGGIPIPGDLGLDGHSDADVLTHALADAILGALALPDIGHLFPNTDPANRGLDSQQILRRALNEILSRGYKIGNVDIALLAERPKLAPFIPAMKTLLATTLNLTPDDIGIKATTNEGCDAIGAGQAIAAHAIVLLTRAV